MKDPAIKVEGLSKRYRIGLEEEQHDTLMGALTSWVKQPVKNYRRLKKLSSFEEDEADDIIWALKDVSFEVGRGEVVGVIGRNGAGKSTLLKILSQITEPTRGYADIRGRVSSLLEVGTGFHPELTGRENVYLNGTILGMTKAEVDRKFDEIVAFSGVEKFIDTPVKRYSSGMKVRLAFAVAAHLEPEILLIDEVLAVGDVGFQKKCLGKMEDVTKEGRTVLFVSHNMGAVEALCKKSILIEGGELKVYSSTSEVIGQYAQSVSTTSSALLRNRKDRSGTGKARFVEMKLFMNSRPSSVWKCGGECAIELECEATNTINDPRILVGIKGVYGEPIAMLDSRTGEAALRGTSCDSKFSISCSIPRLSLAPGSYTINLALYDASGLCDHVVNAGQIDVVKGDFFKTGKMVPRGSAKCLIDHEWNVLNQPVPPA